MGGAISSSLSHHRAGDQGQISFGSEEFCRELPGPH